MLFRSSRRWCRAHWHPNQFNGVWAFRAGLFPAFALFGLSALLWTPALFLAGVPGMTRARRLMTGGGQSGPGVSWALLALCGGLALAAALTERWVAPVLLRAAARVVL